MNVSTNKMSQETKLIQSIFPDGKTFCKIVYCYLFSHYTHILKLKNILNYLLRF